MYIYIHTYVKQQPVQKREHEMSRQYLRTFKRQRLLERRLQAPREVADHLRAHFGAPPPTPGLCDRIAEHCPWCPGNSGTRVHFERPSGEFYGCSNFHVTGCTWTESILRIQEDYDLPSPSPSQAPSPSPFQSRGGVSPSPSQAPSPSPSQRGDVYFEGIEVPSGSGGGGPNFKISKHNERAENLIFNMALISKFVKPDVTANLIRTVCNAHPTARRFPKGGSHSACRFGCFAVGGDCVLHYPFCPVVLDFVSETVSARGLSDLLWVADFSIPHFPFWRKCISRT